LAEHGTPVQFKRKFSFTNEPVHVHYDYSNTEVL